MRAFLFISFFALLTCASIGFASEQHDVKVNSCGEPLRCAQCHGTQDSDNLSLEKCPDCGTAVCEGCQNESQGKCPTLSCSHTFEGFSVTKGRFRIWKIVKEKLLSPTSKMLTIGILGLTLGIGGHAKYIEQVEQDPKVRSVVSPTNIRPEIQSLALTVQEYIPNPSNVSDESEKLISGIRLTAESIDLTPEEGVLLANAAQTLLNKLRALDLPVHPDIDPSVVARKFARRYFTYNVVDQSELLRIANLFKDIPGCFAAILSEYQSIYEPGGPR